MDRLLTRAPTDRGVSRRGGSDRAGLFQLVFSLFSACIQFFQIRFLSIWFLSFSIFGFLFVAGLFSVWSRPAFLWSSGRPQFVRGLFSARPPPK
jgi:hypothetical protein